MLSYNYLTKSVLDFKIAVAVIAGICFFSKNKHLLFSVHLIINIIVRT